jgi:Na+-driven multidrug efflux pump
MRLDAKHDREMARRKGLALRTILAVVWLAICIGIAYLIVTFLFDNEILSYRFFYTQLYVPREVSETVILIGLIFVIVVIINFFVLIGFAIASPVGRRRPGTPSLHSSDPDPDDRKYDYR